MRFRFEVEGQSPFLHLLPYEHACHVQSDVCVNFIGWLLIDLSKLEYFSVSLPDLNVMLEQDGAWQLIKAPQSIQKMSHVKPSVCVMRHTTLRDSILQPAVEPFIILWLLGLVAVLIVFL